jgi:hypothetical protein
MGGFPKHLRQQRARDGGISVRALHDGDVMRNRGDAEPQLRRVFGDRHRFGFCRCEI